MTHNLSKIMKSAWRAYNQFRPFRFCRATFAYKLRQAWADARNAESLAKVPNRRETLEAELAALPYSDAIGTAAKMREISAEIRHLPLAA